MTGLVYIIDRDGELDVYAGLLDAEEALEILGVGYSIVEQAVVDLGTSANTSPRCAKPRGHQARHARGGLMDISKRASHGRKAIEVGTPDFEYNDPYTNGVDAVANILHALYEDADIAVAGAGYRASELLQTALDHFEAELEGDW